MKEKNQAQKNDEKTLEFLEIFCCIDASGSMNRIRTETIHAFKNFLKDQKKDDINKTTHISVILFNTQISILWSSLPISQVEFSSDSYCPYGETAMLDAMFEAISSADEATMCTSCDPQPAPIGRDKNVLICVISDGRENASRKYGYDDVRNLIQSHLSDERWDLVFLTSDWHAKQMAMSQLGIPEDNIEVFECTAEGIRDSFGKMSQASMAKKRTKQKIDSSWKSQPKSQDQKGH